jgi:iron complex transport system substrate-binding protein
MIKKIIVFLVSLVVLVLAVAGCTQTAPSPAPTTTTPTSTTQQPVSQKFVFDQIGNKVELPATVNKVANFSYQMVELQMTLGATDKLVAGSYYGDVPWLDARLKSLPNPYNSQTGVLNIEELLKVNPDLVVMWGGTPKGEMEKAWQAGYPVICDWTMGQGATERAIQMLGKALGKDVEAQNLLSFWSERQKVLKDVISKIPIEQRTTVFYTGHGKLITCSKDTDEDWWTMEAGGINVARNASGLPWGTASWWMQLSVESVIDWDPDIIIISSKAGIDPADILNDPQWKDIKAVKEGKVYRVPYGFHVWDRPCAERILGQEWLANILYPDKFNFNVREDTKTFFQQFFKVNLSEQEIDKILAGQK